MNWAEKAGITRLELTVMAHNERAIRLYERMGFEREGILRRALRADDEWVDELFMALLLTSEAVGDFPERVEVPRARLAGRAGAPALEFDARNAHRPPIPRQPSEIESEEGGRGHVSRELEGEAGGTPGR